jgi:hypothetical protein
MKFYGIGDLLLAPLVVAIAVVPALADVQNSSGAQGQMGNSSDYTRQGVNADRQVHDYRGNTSTNTPKSLGGLPPCTTAILSGIYGTPDYSTDWGPLPSDAAPIVNQLGTPYEYKTRSTNSYYNQQPINNDYAGTDISALSGAVGSNVNQTQNVVSAYTNFVKNWKGPGPPPVPIFQCAYGWGWMPQAGAGGTSNPGGGYHGQDGGIVRTGSWDPSSLGSGF